MTYRVHPAFIAFLGAIAVLLAANETFARSGSTSHRAFASARSSSHPSFARSHHRRNNTGTFWPAVEDDGFYGSSNGEPIADVTQPSSGDVHYTYDVPWDWAHRYPPAVTPSDRPYAPSCPEETTTFPGRDGKDRTVSVMRCY